MTAAEGTLTIGAHDGHPPDEATLIDAGLGDANAAAAALHEVQALSCFARTGTEQVVGGAIGRRWGSCCELQQLWVAAPHRRKGIGSSLVRAFEAHARTHGCSCFYLETFSFQAPELYRSLGYQVAYAHGVYPHGIVKYVMVKHDTAVGPERCA
jgi:GNAT superfamily N-acetyltransferase